MIPYGQGSGLSSRSSRPDCPEEHNSQDRPNKRPRITLDETRHSAQPKIFEGQLGDSQPGHKIKLILPQHTDETFRKYSQDQRSAVVPVHRVFSRGDVRFTHIQELGRGSFGVVDKVEPSSGLFLPGKIYARKAFTIRRRQFASNELDLLEMARTLLHPHILTTVMTYEEECDSHNLHYGIILNPVASCTLQAFLEKSNSTGHSGEFVTTRVEKWLSCLGSGLSYLHAKNLIHRQISPSSILVKDGEIFFTEFAISNHFKGTEGLLEELSRAGAMWETYQAPEAQTQQLSGPKADIFSLGCVFIELLTLASGMSLMTLYDWLRQQPFPTYQRCLPKTLEWLAQVQSHLTVPTLQSFGPYCEKMLQLDPSSRPSAFDVTKFLFESNLKHSKASGATLDPVCNCLLPWKGKDDEPCRLLISMPGTSRAVLGPEALPPPPGRYNLSTDSLGGNNACPHCSQSFDNFMDILFHIATQHHDKADRVDSLTCNYGECEHRPPFQDEQQYQDHQLNFHGEGFPGTSEHTRQGTV